MNDEQLIAVMHPEECDGAGLASSQGNNNNEIPEEEWNSMEAREFGQKLCEKTETDWAAAQIKDETSKTAIEYILAGAGDITESDSRNSR